MKNPLVFFFIIASFYSFNTIPAQTNQENNNIWHKAADDAADFFDVGFGLAESPFNFSVNDWLTTGAIAGGTALLFMADKSARKFAMSNQTDLNNKIFNFDNYYGNIYTAVFTVGLYGYGLFTNNNGIRKLGLQAAEAFIYSGLITGALKILIGRRRPYAGDSHLFFKPLQLTNNDFQSLPSGHTTIAFAVSTVMAHYFDNIFWKSFWYGAAGMVAFSRVYHNQHWVSDVFLGSAVGFFVGNFIVHRDEKGKDSDDVGFRYKIYPSVLVNGIGLSFNAQF